MTRRRPPPRWVSPEPVHEEAVQQLAASLQLPRAMCALLVRRGFADPVAARDFLRPRMEMIASPHQLADASRAADRVAQAIRQHETIFVHGDYDVDGMSSTAILTRVLRTLGARVVPWVPHRMTDGYDLGARGVAEAQRAGARLVITCDCGTSAHDAVRTLMLSGIDVIVTDHHLPGQGLPPAFAVVNPQRPDCPSPDKDLAGAGVAYKVALAVCEAMQASPRIAHEQLDLVALATIADVAQLRGENRVLVRYGLKLLQAQSHPGLSALMRAAAIDPATLTAGRVGYALAPRLNAVGRVADAKRGVELLLTEDTDTANALARELEELNRARRALDEQVLSDALRQVDACDLQQSFGFVLAQQGWHPGVIGVVASRVVEQTGRPTILVALEDGIGKGSGRSTGKFDLHAALTACSPHLQRYGGHRVAAGLTVTEENLPSFRDAFAEIARTQLTPDDLVSTVRIDWTVEPSEITDDLERLLRHFEPCGVGNPSPVLAMQRAQLSGPPRRIGVDGVKFEVELPTCSVGAVAWGDATRDAALDVGAPIDLAFRLERNEYRGRSSLQLKVQSARTP
jgi:single-stranded-DNA-specific exonuclease